MATFAVPDQYAGKTLKDLYNISSAQNVIFDPGGVGQWGGVDPNTPLKAGMTFNAPDDPGSGGVKFLSQFFTPQAQYQADQNRNILQQSSQQAISTLEGGKEPLKKRYDDIIASIRGTKQQEVQQADITSAQELGRRGIPTSSTYAGEFQQQRRLPVQTAFAGQEAAAGLSAEQAQQNIRNAIAQIQQATGRDEVQAALQAYQNAEQARQFNESLALQKEELNFRRDQASAPQQTDQFTTLSEGQTLFDLLSGNPVYTAPKTYKPTGTGQESFNESNWS